MSKSTFPYDSVSDPDADFPGTASLPIVSTSGAVEGKAPTTGRFIVIYKENARDSEIVRASLYKYAGIKSIPVMEDYMTGDRTSSFERKERSRNFLFQNLGIAVVAGQDEVMSLAASVSDSNSPILAIEPEYIAYPSFNLHQDYLKGFKDAVNFLYDSLTADNATVAGISGTDLSDTDQYTWGLQATRAHTSSYSGKGIKIAVLDTGFDVDHPDFVGRLLTTASFSGAPFADVHGHGTHCIGTACGPQRPASGVRRYGVAYNAQIFAGKVFNNAALPQAVTEDVLAGIEWAMANQCDIVSLSLGVPINQKALQYETTTMRALKAGLLIIAAAGNNAERSLGNAGFVEPPANADSVIAVGSINRRLGISSFSARSSQTTGDGGKVNIVAPGAGIFSSLPVSVGRHGIKSGTSMAAPHVTGIAALWAEATGLRGMDLWNKLLQQALPLNLSSADCGNGLVQAPN
jgi:subtilisin family serine protease